MAALGCAALVALLLWLAADPTAHARLHPDLLTGDDAGCVIEVFGHGVVADPWTPVLISVCAAILLRVQIVGAQRHEEPGRHLWPAATAPPTVR